MEEGRVSVIMPCYNAEEFIEAAVQSVIWQSYSNWECITVDDGSTDSTPSILKSLAARDSRFHYIRQDNSGPAEARNVGIDQASGEYVQFLDADDIIPENRLSLCVELFQQHPEADVVYTDYVTYQKGQGFVRTLPAKIPHEDAFRAFLFEQNVTFATIIHAFLFKRDLIAANKFDTTLHSHAEDVECWVRLAAAGARFMYLDRILAVYRFSPGTLASEESVLLNAKINVLRSYENHPRCNGYRREYTQAMNYLEQRLAIGYFMKKSFSKGWLFMRRQWPQSPWQAKVKMAGWGLLMLFLGKDQIAAARMWIVAHTPFRWGGWVHYRTWTPPESVRKLLES